ncbi:hypothetical protein PLESTB_001104400 [Pleodorina starrii]|uniref:Uncharacterized protein n=1 Tax=Pleodorina starrii TaxID=330485 RepID=A0A9W6BQH0_9CHLO|nr:hypothetical protein PLESTB_001104400 [Pleodorina starrii]GLC68934.1 hypothetical protein PLESTF_000760600 [Pleodorina starrii]
MGRWGSGEAQAAPEPGSTQRQHLLSRGAELPPAKCRAPRQASWSQPRASLEVWLQVAAAAMPFPPPRLHDSLQPATRAHVQVAAGGAARRGAHQQAVSSSQRWPPPPPSSRPRRRWTAT